jgi:ADP-ribose pyrophosphatase YjhB (NUDIX family)
MGRPKYRNPVPTVDIIIEVMDGGKSRGIVLVERRNPPPGWALPGGFVDYGETLEAAAVREAREETSLEVELLGQFRAYSDPERDPRLHTISTVFLARANGAPRAGDDARAVAVVDPRDRGLRLAFDHRRILDDYLDSRKRRRPCPNPVTRTTPRATTSSRSPESTARSKRT